MPLAGFGPSTPGLLWLIANLLLVFVAWTIIPDLLAAARAKPGKPGPP